MISPVRVATNFLKQSEEEKRDQDGTPYKEFRISMDSQEKALQFIKKLYPSVRIEKEPYPTGTDVKSEGMAYFAIFSKRKQVGNYSFDKEELWYNVYPGTKIPYTPKKREEKA